jgi:carbamoyl-phosphate synthase small subunit
MKWNILRRLSAYGCSVRVYPASTPAQELLASSPDGVFLSNGPGDPAAVSYAVDNTKALVASGVPVFGICLGHQILGLAMGRDLKLKLAIAAPTIRQEARDGKSRSPRRTTALPSIRVAAADVEVTAESGRRNGRRPAAPHPVFAFSAPEASPGRTMPTTCFTTIKMIEEK